MLKATDPSLGQNPEENWPLTESKFFFSISVTNGLYILVTIVFWLA